jgi:endonuclease-3
LEQLIRSTGFYKNKAKNIKACAQMLIERHGGELPRTVEELSALPGVGRKTANVVLGNAFGIPGMVVDTHVMRITNRLGLAKGHDAVKLEAELEGVIAREDWVEFSHLLISHGRAICDARKPLCEGCNLSDVCPKMPYEKK